MLELCQKTEKGVKVVFLTAALPPSKEPTLFHAIGVKEHDMCVFRGNASRKNVAYRVVEYKRDGGEEQVREVVEALKEKYTAPDQMVTYYKRVI